MANYKKNNSWSQWMYPDTKIDTKKIPDPKNHQIISFIKSGIRLAACAFGFFSMYELAFIGLFLAEIVGIGEELV
jgi:hypothetical protein